MQHNLIPASRVYKREALRLHQAAETAALTLREELTSLAARYDGLAVRAAAEESEEPIADVKAPGPLAPQGRRHPQDRR
jgi:hypothetical protein